MNVEFEHIQRVESKNHDIIRNGFRFSSDSDNQYQIINIITEEVHPFSLNIEHAAAQVRTISKNNQEFCLMLRKMERLVDPLRIYEKYIIFYLHKLVYLIVNWRDSTFFVIRIEEILPDTCEVNPNMRMIGDNLYLHHYFEDGIAISEYNIVKNTLRKLPYHYNKPMSVHIYGDEYNEPIVVERKRETLIIRDLATGEIVTSLKNKDVFSARIIGRNIIFTSGILYFRGKDHEINITGYWRDVFVRDSMLYVVTNVHGNGCVYDIYATDLKHLVPRAKSARN